MTKPIFSEDEYDLLLETANNAMGQASAKLAEVLNEMIEISIPEVKMIASSELKEILNLLKKYFDSNVSIVRQGFEEFLNGEAILIFGDGAFEALSKILDDDDNSEGKERELLLDISSILSSAYLNGIGNYFEKKIGILRPSVFCQKIPLKEAFGIMFQESNIKWKHTLILKVSFTMENYNFVCKLLVFFDEASIEKLQNTLREMLKGF
jgi:chemotaxis protein CheY-P-specific phosphatase CheC